MLVEGLIRPIDEIAARSQPEAVVKWPPDSLAYSNSEPLTSCEGRKERHSGRFFTGLQKSDLSATAQTG
jgi:hypothetical protein